MANYDSGHYFLTALIPLRAGEVEVDGRVVSHRQRVEELLSVLPNGEWLAARPEYRAGDRSQVFSPCRRSPFTRVPGTHFTRLVVIADLPWNGRQPGDTLLAALLRRDPLVPQPVERLDCAWLLWGADFDAASSAPSELADWLTQVWQQAGSTLQPLLAHAVGFEAVTDAASFVHYVQRCQVETSLPFNDYWAHPPPLGDVRLGLPLVVGVFGLLLLLIGSMNLVTGTAGAGRALSGLVLIGAAVLWAWLAVQRAANRPYPPPAPPSPPSTLPSVLKALHLQRAFAAFAASHQADDAQALHDAFAVFLAQQRPDALDAATQAPGELGV